MADGRFDTRIFWVDPDKRGVLPLDGFHLPRRLARTVRSDTYRVTIDTAFRQVMETCAEPHPRRQATWINDEIIDLYTALCERGHAHSVECWTAAEDGVDQLAGGLYGVSLGTAFFGESMFARARDASKVALVHLVARLRAGGYTLLDTQFITDHLAMFGAVEIQRDDYQGQLDTALDDVGDFHALPNQIDGTQAIEALT